MYTKNVKLTNKKRVPFCLDNDFDNTLDMIDEIINAKDINELSRSVNKHSKYDTWRVDIDDKSKTRFIAKDWFGNVHYLICEKSKCKMISEKKVRSILKTQLLLLEKFPKDNSEIIERIMMLAEILEMSNEELSDIIDNGYKNFIV